MYKHKCFWIEIVELLEADFFEYEYRVYYNGTCCHSSCFISEQEAKKKAEEWIEDYGFEWLGVEM